jgi:YggT family protein
MLQQIAGLLINAVAGFFVYLLLARFLFQWLRVPFRNPVGAFVVAATNWMVAPARRLIPSLAGFDLASFLLAWLVQGLALFLIYLIGSRVPAADPGALAAVLALVALVDLARFTVFILVFALIVQAVLSWTNPHSPVGPLFDALTRPFLRPLRRVVPPLGGVDLSPLVLIVLLQVLLIPLDYLRGLPGSSF